MAIKIGDGGSLSPIDATDPNNLSEKVLSEKETRKRLLTHARIAEVERGLTGLEREMLMLFAKADKNLRNCRDEQERNGKAALYAIEAYRILGGGGTLTIDGKIVIDDEPKKKD